MNFINTMGARTSRRRLVLAAAAGVLALATSSAGAQPLSNRPIRIIAVGTAGASADILARMVADALSKSMGQPVIVENKPGAGGTVAMEYFLKAPADGHTYMLAVSSLVSELPYTFKPRYDPFKDIKPLVELGSAAGVLVGNAALPPKNLQELVGYVKARKGSVNIGSFSPGGISHILGLQLNQLAGLDMNIVQYNGSTPGLVDVIGGTLQFQMDTQLSSMPLIKAGKLRAFAVSSPQRLDTMPDIPTFAEAGYGAMTRTAWMGLWTLPGVPDAVQQRVRSETLKALAMPAARERLSSLGLNLDAQHQRTPEELSRGLQQEYQATGEVLRAVGYKAQ